MQENYFIKRQKGVRESKANGPKTGHAKRAIKESMDQTTLEGELRKALNNSRIEHCGDGYDDDGNEVSMFGDSTKGTAEAIARYLRGKGFARVSIDHDNGASRDGGTAWFAVVRHDSDAKRSAEKLVEGQYELPNTLGYMEYNLKGVYENIESMIGRGKRARGYASELKDALDTLESLDGVLARNVNDADDCMVWLNKVFNYIKDIKEYLSHLS